MFRALLNAFRIRELRNRILFTVGILALYRFGANLTIPGVDPSKLLDQVEKGIIGMMDLFSGGALGKFSVFSLGIMPYITSSIIMQLLQVVIPKLDALAKEGESGRRKVNQISRYVTVGLALIQSFAMTFYFRNFGAVPNFDLVHVSLIILTLTAGTTVIMWLGELINLHGIGNGISLIIFASIVSRIPGGLISLFRIKGTNWFLIGLFALISVGVVMAIILITQGERRIPVQYAKRIVGRKVFGGQTTYIPLKVNQSGVMPIIFAVSMLLFPATIAQFINVKWLQSLANWLSPSIGGRINPFYIIVYSLLIIAFAYFYTAIAFNPSETSENLRKYGGYIPGLRPGKNTSDFLSNILNRITLPGAIFLAIIAILPEILIDTMGIPFKFGGTSVLIAVSVALETMKWIESQLMMRDYEGFIK
ncbi:MAG: preprotein translocase subunit SecY [Actinobacteria bacterium]|nr:preprotein translocase subunit SecY [Actinomycetota bacterium]MCL6087292.1 preprotein translocase subunit SecY [Actinomycetota bacterium]